MKTIRLHTESGDKYKIEVEDHVDENGLESILRANFADEWTEDNDGPGFRGSYIYLENENEYQEI